MYTYGATRTRREKLNVGRHYVRFDGLVGIGVAVVPTEDFKHDGKINVDE